MFNFFRDLFSRKKSDQIPSSVAIETAPLSEEQLASVSQEKVQFQPPHLWSGMAQSVGQQRDHNEDSLFAMQSVLSDSASNQPFGIYMVADGMGGHLHGEIASGTAVRTLGQYILSHFYIPLLAGTSPSELESLHELLSNGVKEANSAVIQNAPGGGTTLTAALIIGDQVTVAHVGDSRAYFIYPDGRIQVMTQDHSLVRRLQDLGQIDEKEASNHPQRNVLYRAMGQSEPFRPDINTHALPSPGYMLICSDGLWGTVSNDEIFRIVISAPSLSMACHRLVEAANAAGGPDNISAVLVQYLG